MTSWKTHYSENWKYYKSVSLLFWAVTAGWILMVMGFYFSSDKLKPWEPIINVLFLLLIISSVVLGCITERWKCPQCHKRFARKDISGFWNNLMFFMVDDLDDDNMANALHCSHCSLPKRPQ